MTSKSVERGIEGFRNEIKSMTELIDELEADNNKGLALDCWVGELENWKINTSDVYDILISCIADSMRGK